MEHKGDSVESAKIYNHRSSAFRPRLAPVPLCQQAPPASPYRDHMTQGSQGLCHCLPVCRQKAELAQQNSHST